MSVFIQTSKTSPFGRKVRIALINLNLEVDIGIEWLDTTSDTGVSKIQNPLRKVPVLIDSANPDRPILDSRTILAYLDEIHGENILYPNGSQRWDVLSLQAVTDGILDASLLQLYELRFRDEKARSPGWVDHQLSKVTRSLTYCEKLIEPHTRINLNAGEIGLAVALGYLDFRFDGVWRKEFPKLQVWLEHYSRSVPAFELTKP